LALTACSNSETPSSRKSDSLPSSVLASNGTLTLSGDLNGQKLSNEIGTLNVSANALKGDATVTVTRLANDQGLKLPPVNNVNSSFIIGDVPGKKFAGGWNIKVKASKFTAPADLTVNRANVLSGQALNSTITEMFMKDNATGSISLAATFLNNQPLKLESFADLTNELMAAKQGSDADITLFAYTAPQDKYDGVCIKEGGTTKYQACSFADKVLPDKITTQAISGIQTISWNIGNVAITCNAYAFKLCYRSTERAVSDQFLSLEQSGGKPDVIFIQEIFNDACTYIPETNVLVNNFNPRLCSSPSSTTTLSHILGAPGVRYNYYCTVRELVASQYINGYECIAVKVGSPIVLTGQGYQIHPACENNPNTATNYLGRDTGALFLYASLNGKPLNLGSVHLTGTNKPDCRKIQIDKIKADPQNHPRPRIIAGDFNTEPFNDSTLGGIAFRDDFTSNGFGYWASVAPTYGTIIDDAHQSTAYYVGYSPALDHVISDSFTGSCSRGGNFNGTDHVWTRCYLNSGSF
jgi:Endonuclease/Exonuclease/phosphatase family